MKLWWSVAICALPALFVACGGGVDNAMCKSLQQGDFDEAERLLSQGADVNRRFGNEGWRPHLDAATNIKWL